jgi:hypothetical protein
VEERLAFYETGSNPTKNADAMAKVLAAIKSEAVPAEAPAPSTKKSKKRKSEAVAEVPAEAVEAIAQEMEDDSPRKKKKSKKSKDVRLLRCFEASGSSLACRHPRSLTRPLLLCRLLLPLMPWILTRLSLSRR